MRTLLKALLVSGFLLVIVAFVLGLKLNDIKKYYIDDSNYIEMNHVIDEDITKIKIDFLDRNVSFHKTDELSYIEYYINDEQDTINLVEDNDNLNFEIKHKRKLFQFIKTKFTSSKVKNVKIYINDSIKDLSIDTTFGKIEIDNLNFNNLNIETTTGLIKLSNLVITNNLDVRLTTGEISINNVDATKIAITNTTGSVNLQKLLAKDIIVNTTTGTIKINDNRNDIGFKAIVTTGNINLYGEKVKSINDNNESYSIFYTLETTTGNISISK